MELYNLKTQQQTPSFGGKKQADQMRLVALQTGELRHVNHVFAEVLGLGVEDLKGRNLLDVVLFKNPEDLQSDRAVFNGVDHETAATGLNGLQAGSHILLLGRNQDPHNFFFDWVERPDGKRYLIASSFKDDKPTEWTHYREEETETDQTVQKKNQVGNYNKPRSIVDFFSQLIANDDFKDIDKIALDSPIGQSSIGDQDQTVFSKLNDDLKCVLSGEGVLLRADNNVFDKLSISMGDHILDAVETDDRAFVRQFLQSLHAHDDDNITDLSEVAADADSDCHNRAIFQARMITQDGRPLWMEWTVCSYNQSIYCVGHDITHAKINEESLKSRETELSKAQALANMGHWKWVVGSTHLEWSDQIYNIFGVTTDDFLPTLDNANKLIHKRDVGHMMQAFQRAIIEQNDYDIDFRVVRPDETIAYVRCEGRCELDTDGDVVALYGVMQDITAQTEYEMQLRQAKDSAEQAYASKSRFLANMSHELRTPLNAIIGFSDMIVQQMMGPVGAEKYLDYASSINESGKHLLDLITDILDMSKIEAGKYELDLEKLQLGEVVSSAMNMVECRAREGDITIRNNITSNGPEIVADRRAIVQMVLNVLSNAVKFTDKGGVITIHIEDYENHVSIKVQDTGIGIPANKLSSVLLPFEQVSTALTRGHEGSGLGLTITKELAELHGGMLSLESTENVGTIASIRLPRKAVIPTSE